MSISINNHIPSKDTLVHDDSFVIPNGTPTVGSTSPSDEKVKTTFTKIKECFSSIKMPSWEGFKEKCSGCGASIKGGWNWSIEKVCNVFYRFINLYYYGEFSPVVDSDKKIITDNPKKIDSLNKQIDDLIAITEKDTRKTINDELQELIKVKRSLPLVFNNNISNLIDTALIKKRCSTETELTIQLITWRKDENAAFNDIIKPLFNNTSIYLNRVREKRGAIDIDTEFNDAKESIKNEMAEILKSYSVSGKLNEWGLEGFLKEIRDLNKEIKEANERIASKKETLLQEAAKQRLLQEAELQEAEKQRLLQEAELQKVYHEAFSKQISKLGEKITLNTFQSAIDIPLAVKELLSNPEFKKLNKDEDSIINDITNNLKDFIIKNFPKTELPSEHTGIFSWISRQIFKA